MRGGRRHCHGCSWNCAFSASLDLGDTRLIAAQMISQLAQALSRRSLSPLVHVHFGGLLNTSYHSFTIEFEPLEGYEPDLFDDELPSPYPDATARFTLRVDRTAEAGHLDGLKRQKAGIGRIAHDPSQRKLSDFFAGGGTIRTSRA